MPVNMYCMAMRLWSVGMMYFDQKVSSWGWASWAVSTLTECAMLLPA